jgi:peptidoglycan/xylan/chitin deacetylase (PgdA/CDA1 family)
MSGQRLSLPGWLLAISIVAFVGTWVAAPQRSLSGSNPAPSTPVSPRDPGRDAPALQIQPEADPAGEQRRSNELFVFSRPWRIALTFDDGPHHAQTARLLDILAEHGVHATFFVNGRWIADAYSRAATNRAILRRARLEGHAIGSHTYHHVNLTRLPKEEQTWEITANEAIIQQVIGERPTLFRPPYAVLSRHSLAVLRERHYVIARWNSAALDEEIHDPETIQRTVMLWLRHHQGGIVMLHDRFRWTVDAVARVLHELARENCRRERAGQPLFEVVSLDSFLLPPAQSGPLVDAGRTPRVHRQACSGAQGRSSAPALGRTNRLGTWTPAIR